MNELALFAGAGGGILGGKLLGWRTVCAVEIERDCQERLLQRQREGFLPPFPIWDDVRTFDGRPWRGRVDIVSGGFPCTDISAAGKGAGIEGPESGLWKDMSRIIGEVRPRFAWVENSPILTSRGLGVVLGDLAAMGFDAEWGVVSSSDAGGSSLRERIWILAHAPEFRRELAGCSRERRAGFEDDDRGEDVAIGPRDGDGRISTGRREKKRDKTPNACGHRTPMADAIDWKLQDARRKQGGRTRVGSRSKAVADTGCVCGGSVRPEPGTDKPGANVHDQRRCEVVADGASIGRREGRAESEGEQGGCHVAVGDTALGDTDRSGFQERGQTGTSTGAKQFSHPDVERPSGAGETVEPGLGGDADGLAAWMDAIVGSGRPKVAGRGPDQFPWEPPRTVKGYPDRAQRIRAIGNGQDPWALALAWEILSSRAVEW